MILVDTSVFIDYFRNIENPKTDQFQLIIDQDLNFAINNYIFQELLQGCKTEKDYKLLKNYLETQRFIDFKNGRESYAYAAKIYFSLRKKGITMRSTIDCLIAQMAIENNCFLLHNDEDFILMSRFIPLKIWEFNYQF